jgi:DNA-binding beta-propeller fold protein YncE
VILLPLLATLTVLISACAVQAKPLQAAAGLATSPGSGSALVGSAPVGNGPSELALDPATHTIYVANGNNANGPNAGGNTVSVIDARHCNAQDVSHCKGPWPTITVGNLPSTIAIDQHTDTVYVTDSGDNTVSVFNGATCNALVTSGCGQKPATVPVGRAPLGIFADPDHVGNRSLPLPDPAPGPAD